jgi:hypothetical protein
MRQVYGSNVLEKPAKLLPHLQNCVAFINLCLKWASDLREGVWREGETKN